MRFLPGSLLTVVAVLFACAATAQAQQRYAAPPPVGSGAICTKAAPCTLVTAIEEAKDNDEVIVGTGTYTLTETLSPNDYQIENLSVHGDFEAPMPVITSSASATLYIGGNGGGVLSWVDVRATGQGGTAISCTDTTVERVRASSSGTEGAAMAGTRCNIRDTLAVASGDHSIAISQYGFFDGLTGSVVNSTALATGPSSDALTVSFPSPGGSGTYTVEVANTIAQGTNADLHAYGFGGEIGKFVISHSNFDNAAKLGTGIITDAGGNQSAAPLFTNAAAGDYAEAAGSPTIDAGIATPAAGALDLAGNTRTLGGAIDIGAFEFLSPAPPPILTTTPAAGRIKSIAITPSKFVAANLGGAVISKKGKKAPVGATVFFSLNASATVTFKAKRKGTGRKAGKKCVKQTKANRGKPKCALLKPVKGSFTVAGVAGPNAFKFSGRIGKRTLGPGKYMLSGSAGGATKQAAFRIVQ